MKNIRIYKTYAKVFFNKAKLDKALENVLSDFYLLSNVLSANKKLERFFASNISSFEEKIKVIELCKMHATSMHLMHLLIKSNQVKYLPDIYDEMVSLKLSEEGVTKATLVSSSDMTAKEIEVCKEALEKKLDKKFAIEHKVDESLIGGVVLKFGTMMYDASVRTALQRVRELRI